MTGLRCRWLRSRNSRDGGRLGVRGTEVKLPTRGGGTGRVICSGKLARSGACRPSSSLPSRRCFHVASGRGDSHRNAVSHPCERVLVVNDQRDIVELLAEALRIAGATVEAALGAKDALRIVEKGFRPSVILTDLMMPERSGEELINDLRLNPATRDVPIVAMSASSQHLVRLDGKVDRRLTKPFRLETLYSTLASVCEGERAAEQR